MSAPAPASASAADAAASGVYMGLSSSSSCAPRSPFSNDAVSVSEDLVKRSEITAHFQASEPRFRSLNQTTVSRWLRSEDKFKKLVLSHQAAIIRDKSVRHPQVERCLCLWLDRLPLNQYIKLTGREVKYMTKSIYDALGVPADERLELSNGWLSRFQARHGLKLHKTRGGDTGVDSVEMEQFRLQEVVQEFIAAGGGRTMNDVWNMDEASFFYDCSPVVAVDEDIEVDAMKKVETRLTVTLATNATGSERLEPIFIGHVSQDMKLLGCGRFYCNSTAWMTGDIFCAWLKTWNQELVNASRRVLLLVDKFRGHKADLAALTNIQLEFLSPAVTDFVQPGCVGLNDTFHANYRQLVVHRALIRLRSSKICDNLFEIDLPEAVALAKTAWQNVEMARIAACWMHTQILPVQHEESHFETAHVPSQMTNTLVLKPLQELQEVLNVFRAEFQVRQLPVTLYSAVDFVKLGANNALGKNVSVSKIVEMIRRDDNVKTLATGSNANTTEGADSTICSRTEITLFDEVAPRSTQLRHSASTIDPSDVLKSLAIMESHWRATEAKLPNDMLDLLVRTRESLQCEFASQ
ncbi:hypothetical protein PRNP1_000136 [Phytophthora ramorum]